MCEVMRSRVPWWGRLCPHSKRQFSSPLNHQSIRGICTCMYEHDVYLELADIRVFEWCIEFSGTDPWGAQIF